MTDFEDELDALMGDEVAERLFDDEFEKVDVRDLTPEGLDNMVHTLLARRLVEALRMPVVSAGIMQCALRFCKDNDINALPIPGSATELVRKKLGDQLPFRLTGTEE
jgi:hypothetical protein